MDEKYNVFEPDATITELVIMAAHELTQNNMNAFEFDVHGIAPDGAPIILHFQATIQKVGSS